jgi:hypothetical protein
MKKVPLEGYALAEMAVREVAKVKWTGERPLGEMGGAGMAEMRERDSKMWGGRAGVYEIEGSSPARR